MKGRRVNAGRQRYRRVAVRLIDPPERHALVPLEWVRIDLTVVEWQTFGGKQTIRVARRANNEGVKFPSGPIPPRVASRSDSQKYRGALSHINQFVELMVRIQVPRVEEHMKLCRAAEPLPQRQVKGFDKLRNPSVA